MLDGGKAKMEVEKAEALWGKGSAVMIKATGDVDDAHAAQAAAEKEVAAEEDAESRKGVGAASQMLPTVYSIRGSCQHNGPGGTTSSTRTFLAPRSTSISTRRLPTKPVPPVTTHTAGTGGNFCRLAFSCSALRCGDRASVPDIVLAGIPRCCVEDALGTCALSREGTSGRRG